MLPAAPFEPARGIRIREDDGIRSGDRRQVDELPTSERRDDVDRIDAGELERLRQVLARDDLDARVRIGVAYAQEQRDKSERDVAEPTVPREYEAMTARAHGFAQRAVERRAANA